MTGRKNPVDMTKMLNNCRNTGNLPTNSVQKTINPTKGNNGSIKQTLSRLRINASCNIHMGRRTSRIYRGSTSVDILGAFNSWGSFTPNTGGTRHSKNMTFDMP